VRYIDCGRESYYGEAFGARLAVLLPASLRDMTSSRSRIEFQWQFHWALYLNQACHAMSKTNGMLKSGMALRPKQIDRRTGDA
jgi:hypothetical protein